MENKNCHHKETPRFDYELKKWLTLHSIGTGPHRLSDVIGKVKKVLGQEISSLTLINIISDFLSSGYVNVIVRNNPVYKEDGNTYKFIGNNNESHYFLTPKGKERLIFGWDFAASSLPKEYYNEIDRELGAISLDN